MRRDPANIPSHRLESLLALTDTAPTRLSVEDLLVELLNRVRDILEADTAAVLLLEEESQQLVATAACGIEEEVRLGVRVPVGRGFAGRIAQFKQPVLLDRVDSATVYNPILWQKGIQVMLGVPLLAGDDVIGVVHVGRLIHRPFTSADADLLQVVAERVAGAAQARLLAVERAATAMVERSLMPGRLPECPGFEFAARYLTPEESAVGGDWYDVFMLPSGQLWLVTGDVAGHGLRAAVVMGRVKSALRAYTLLDLQPEGVLELTDRKIRNFEIEEMVTVVCATSSPPYDEFRIANAGHVPPVIASPGEPAEILQLPAEHPLGIGPGPSRSSQAVRLGRGSVMLLYTDGLVERRDEPLDVSFERLRQSVSADDPALVCHHVLETFIGSGNPRDDVALVAIRRTEGP